MAPEPEAADRPAVRFHRYERQYERFGPPTDLQGVFDGSDPVELLPSLELVWTAIGQAGI